MAASSIRTNGIWKSLFKNTRWLHEKNLFLSYDRTFARDINRAERRTAARQSVSRINSTGYVVFNKQLLILNKKFANRLNLAGAFGENETSNLSKLQ